MIAANNPCLSCYLQHSALCNPTLCVNRTLYLNQEKHALEDCEKEGHKQ